MKTAELFEYKYRRKSEEEKEALRRAPDYWRLQLRKELTKFNQQFGITLRKPYTFSRYDTDIADIGGEYNVLVSGEDSMTFPKEKRFELWKKAYAQKIHKLVQDGYRVHIAFHFHGSQVKPDESVDDIRARMEHEMKTWRAPSAKHPIMGSFRIVVKKPDENRPAL
jgi:hypothetical protein